MTGEINETSRQLGELAGTVTALTDQQRALFRKLDAQNVRIEALTVSFTGYSQAQQEAASGEAHRIQMVEDHIEVNVDPHVQSLNDFKKLHEDREKQKTKRMAALFVSGGASGGILSQMIDYFRGVT